MGAPCVLCGCPVPDRRRPVATVTRNGCSSEVSQNSCGGKELPGSDRWGPTRRKSSPEPKERESLLTSWPPVRRARQSSPWQACGTDRESGHRQFQEAPARGATAEHVRCLRAYHKEASHDRSATVRRCGRGTSCDGCLRVGISTTGRSRTGADDVDPTGLHATDVRAGVPFVDITCTTGFDPRVEQLGLDGITAGWGGGKYCPGTPVTRDPAGRAPPGPYRAAFPGGVQGIDVRTHSGGLSALVSQIGQKCS